jgi:hypothetical protein
MGKCCTSGSDGCSVCRVLLSGRLSTRIRVYVAALKQDKTLTDQLAHQINKW